jgi:hypothetical protein
MNRVRYIPPVDTPCYSTYMGCYRVSPPIESRGQNPMGTNPQCPVTMCSQTAGPDCKCNMDHQRAPNLRRYWVYKWNQY